MQNRIWAPWRIKYVTGKRSKGCVFCGPAKKYVVERSNHSFSILNIFPYNPGHLMVVPRRHVRGLHQLSRDELLDLFLLVERTRNLLERAIKPHGFNIGINLGKYAGAGIWRHLHVHVVPRWQGDTNCMPIIANTKVVSASLDGLAALLLKTARRNREKPASLKRPAGSH